MNTYFAFLSVNVQVPSDQDEDSTTLLVLPAVPWIPACPASQPPHRDYNLHRTAYYNLRTAYYNLRTAYYNLQHSVASRESL